MQSVGKKPPGQPAQALFGGFSAREVRHHQPPEAGDADPLFQIGERTAGPGGGGAPAPLAEEPLKLRQRFAQASEGAAAVMRQRLGEDGVTMAAHLNHADLTLAAINAFCWRTHDILPPLPSRALTDQECTDLHQPVGSIFATKEDCLMVFLHFVAELANHDQPAAMQALRQGWVVTSPEAVSEYLGHLQGASRAFLANPDRYIREATVVACHQVATQMVAKSGKGAIGARLGLLSVLGKKDGELYLGSPALGPPLRCEIPPDAPLHFVGMGYDVLANWPELLTCGHPVTLQENNDFVAGILTNLPRLLGTAGIDTIVTDDKLPKPPKGPAGAIVCSQFHEMSAQQADVFLMQANANLMPGGTLVWTAPTDPNMPNTVGADQIRQLLANNGFKVREEREYPYPAEQRLRSEPSFERSPDELLARALYSEQKTGSATAFVATKA